MNKQIHPSDFVKCMNDNISIINRNCPNQPPKTYFLTTSFNLPNTGDDLIKRHQDHADEQMRFFEHIVNQTVNNKRKKPYRIPVMMSYFDIGGSRENNPSLIAQPHFHSVVIVPGPTINKFDRLVKDGFRIDRPIRLTRHIRNPHCKEIISPDNDADRIHQYASKLMNSRFAQRYGAGVYMGFFDIYGSQLI